MEGKVGTARSSWHRYSYVIASEEGMMSEFSFKVRRIIEYRLASTVEMLFSSRTGPPPTSHGERSTRGDGQESEISGAGCDQCYLAIDPL
jgi:hypothetical protein